MLLYAVTDAGLEAASGEGLENRPLRTVGCGGLRAIVSDVDAAPPADAQMLWAYEGVVTRLMDSAAVLPVRFGTTAQSDGEITAMLAAREGELARALERVRGAVEFAVHVEPGAPEAPQDAEKPGTAYMRGLLARDERRRELESRAGELVRARARRSASSFAYLVDRERADRFENLAGGLGLSITGPWPPYSFVGGAT